MRNPVISLLALLALAGCATPYTPPASAQSSPAQVAAPQSPFPGIARPVDKTRSRIGAVGSKITGSHTIQFPNLTGSAYFDGQKPTGLDLSVEIAGLSSDNANLTGHLLSPDFFDAARLPQATFRSTRIEAASTAGTYTVAGDLTIRGVTRGVSFPATVSSGTGEVKATAAFSIDRQDYGVSFPGMTDNLIQDEVPLSIEVVVPGA